MRKRLLTALWTTPILMFFLWVAIHNFKKNPADNIALFSISFLSVMLALSLLLTFAKLEKYPPDQSSKTGNPYKG
jgi:uncharacterized membrane protein YoaK (UPF0700 family)